MLIKLEINRKSIEKNLKLISEINKNIICVLKDDAYGLGIGNILPILIENGYRHFAVAYMEESLKIKKIVNRDYPDIADKISIMTLNYIERSDVEKALDNNIEITIFSIYQLNKYKEIFKRWHNKTDKNNINNERTENNKTENNKTKNNRINNDKAVNLKNVNDNFTGEKIKIHIKVNTGMNRLGFNEDEIENLSNEIKEIEKTGVKLDIMSVYSHISHSEDIESTEKQIKLYENILTDLSKHGIEYKYRHIQASPLLFKYKEKYNYDFARLGMTIYGMEPLYENVGLEQTVRLTSKVINIRKVNKGEYISYGSNNVLTENKTVAVIPIGYAHGLQKQIENSNAYVLIKGKRAYLIGEVCMDMIIVDITHIHEVSVDDEVVIIGKSKFVDKNTGETTEQEITLLQMAEWANTIQDDILSKWDKNIKREVVFK